MRMFRLKKNVKQNSGFSIVELVVAIGILAVIGTIVAFMMTSSSKNYRKLSLEAQLQSEAQLVANAISEYAIDSYDAKNQCVNDPGGDFDNDENKILVLKSRDKIAGSDAYQESEFVIARNKASNELYLIERTLNDPDHPNDPASWSEESALLGTYISDFTVDLSHMQSDNIINFKLDYTKNERSYKGNYQVLMRNRAYADREVTPETPNVPNKLFLGLNPKNVYVDVVRGRAGSKYYLNSIDDVGFTLSDVNGVYPIRFNATCDSTRGSVSNEVEWKVTNGFRGNFDFSVDEDTLSSEAFVTLKATDHFYDGKDDDYVISIERSIMDENGEVISGTPKQAKIHLRRVKGITLNATSGSTSWKKTYTDLGGVPAADADVKGYCYADAFGNYQTMNLNATVIQKWVPYGGGLEWELEMKPIGDDSEWTSDVDSRYARLLHSETPTSTMNSVIFGKNVTNGQLFKVTVTSKFDDSQSATYVFGVAPWRQKTSNGIYSRGYYTNLTQYLADTNFGSSFNGNQSKMKEAIENNRKIRIALNYLGNEFDANAIRLTQDDYGDWYLYIDYGSFMYSYGTQTIDFYRKGTGSSGMSFNVFIVNDDGTEEKVADDLKYFIAPVHVHKDDDTPAVIVLSPGAGYPIRTQTQYYNILGEDYIGVYVNNGESSDASYWNSNNTYDYNKYEALFGPNLNAGGMYDTNPYLTVQVTSGYGDVQHYVDTVGLTLTAKTPSNVRNANPMRIRVTADKYYKLVIGNYSGTSRKDELAEKDSNQKWNYDNSIVWYRSPMAEYVVVTANVIGENSFIVGPSTVSYADERVKFDTNVIRTKNQNNAVWIAGYDTNGNLVEHMAKAFYSNGSFRCVYKGTVYTYNETYHYWSR